jgi:two-component system, cell cycle sensor histidine kinase and response regulator CckA
LAFSRQQILTPTVLNLNDLVADMQKVLPRLIGEDITVTMGMEPELQSVRAGRNQIEQVIMNLAVNSRDAMPAGGEIRIDTKNVYLDDAYTRLHLGVKVGQYLCLSVTDTGGGMDAETLGTFSNRFLLRRRWAKARGWGWPRFTAS